MTGEELAREAFTGACAFVGGWLAMRKAASSMKAERAEESKALRAELRTIVKDEIGGVTKGLARAFERLTAHEGRIAMLEQMVGLLKLMAGIWPATPPPRTAPAAAPAEAPAPGSTPPPSSSTP